MSAHWEFFAWWATGWMFTGSLKYEAAGRPGMNFGRDALMLLWWPASLGELLGKMWRDRNNP